MRFVLRVLAFLLVLVALFEPVWTRTSQRLHVLFVVDVSSSVDPASLAETLAWLAEVEAPSAELSADISYLAFAGQPRLVESLEELRSLPVTNLAEEASPERLLRTRTDVEQALRLARSTFEPGAIKRLVLLSDGRFGQANPSQALAGLVLDDVRIDTRALPSALGLPTITRLELGAEPRARSPLPLDLTVISAAAREIRVTVRAGEGSAPDVLLADLETAVQAGSQRVPLLVRLPSSGDFDLSVSVDDQVQWRQAIEVLPRPSVLLVAGAGGASLRTALQAQGWSVRQIAAEALGNDATFYEPYQAVLLSNVAGPRLGHQRMVALRDWVIAGGGLLFAGGESVFGESGYSETPLETILPLRFNVEEERADVALMIALDKSYSMKGAKIELAKEATKAALGELQDQHRFGVVAFDWEPYDVVPLDLVTTRERMLDSISRIEASAQTNFYPALESCFRQLSAVEAEVKHVILLSDGKTYPDDYQGLVTRMREQEITVSTVGVGSEADRELLADIARWGGGQTYFVRDAKRVQRILLDEARGKLEETLVEEPVRAVSVSASQALRGIDLDRAPALLGHLNLEPREDAEVVLETDSGKPLLARRNVGLGRTWIFTSDLDQRWSAEWVRWRDFGPLWSQVLHDAAGRRSPRALTFDVERQGDLLVASLRAIDEAGGYQNGLDARLLVSTGDRRTEHSLRQIAPGRYQSRLALVPNANQSYDIELLIDGERRAMRSFFYPATDEERPALAEPERLQHLSRATAGFFDPTLDQIFDPGTEHATRAVQMWPWLLGLALALYLLDLGLRRKGTLGPRPQAVAFDVGQPVANEPAGRAPAHEELVG